jgi:RNA recognition motif-containing protein
MELIEEMVRITKDKIIISTPHLEFQDPEHLFEYDEKDLIKMLSPYGKVKCETIKSDRFKGRSYTFALCELKK